LKNLNPIHTVAIKYGSIATLLSIILFLILYYAGQNPLLIPAFLDFRILLFPIFLVFSIREFKENYNSGFLHFWQGFSIGLMVILIIAFLMSVFIWIFGSWVEQEFVSNFIQLSIDQIESARKKIQDAIGEEELTKVLEILPSTTLFDLALDYLLKSLPYGLFLTIIISLILRKKPNF
jgi:hypothetical protein